MNRKDFLKLSAALIAGYSIPSKWSRFADGNSSRYEIPASLDDSYLIKGLTAMTRTEHWFDAHWGAALIAGYYLCKENQIHEQTAIAVKDQLDAMIQLRTEQFAPLHDEQSDETLIDELPLALHPALEGGLRAHGHAVIFTSLSLKALRDVPQMAQPGIIQRLCDLIERISKNTPQSPNASWEPYLDSQEMIESTFNSLTRFKELLGRPSILRPNFTHMITHTEALLNLEEMGYDDLAKKGHIGHHVHISAPVPEVDHEIESTSYEASLEHVMSPGFWNNTDHQDQWKRAWNATDNRNGHWIAAGHLFKVLYAFHRLINKIENEDEADLCSRILLERYVNPGVQGG
jgi:hypothetical protein